MAQLIKEIPESLLLLNRLEGIEQSQRITVECVSIDQWLRPTLDNNLLVAALTHMLWTAKKET
jgi:hypothetical protein